MPSPGVDAPCSLLVLGLLAGNWEQLSVCPLKGTPFIRIFSQGPFWGPSSRCRFLGWEGSVLKTLTGSCAIS